MLSAPKWILQMNIVEILRIRILEEFPNISPEELQIRLELVHELLEHIRK